MDRTEFTVASALSTDDVAGATRLRRETFAREAGNDVCVVDGMGLRLSVERGALVVEDGMGDQRRTRRFDKIDAAQRLKRLVVIGSTGYWTVDALHWCRRVGIPVLVLGPDGSTALASAGYGNDDARLRRAQVAAEGTDLGLDIVRDLLRAKMAGHAANARNVLGDDATADVVEAFAYALDGAGDIADARGLEAQAAAAYFAAWPDDTAVRFVAKDAGRVPAHWCRFGGRRSALRRGHSNQRAERPLNALLNYTYRLAEAEARLAILAVGLDPGLGFLHADYPGRDALALDLLEPVRPAVERYVLRLAAERRFRKAEFCETPDGHVRLLAPLTHLLAETMPAWAQEVAPYAELVAHRLADVVPGRIVKRTPLTSRRRRQARRSAAGGRRPVPGPALPRPVCTGCGAPLGRSDASCCPACLPAVKAAALRQAGQASQQARRRRRAAGLADPAASPQVRKRLADAIGSRDAEALAWSAAHPDAQVDPADFARIRAGLATIPVSRIVEASGLSKTYAASVRRGESVPHRRHWPALAELAGVPLNRDDVDGDPAVDVGWWRSVLQPALATVPVAAIEAATGLSSGSASKLRRGIQVPHPRHWPALASVAAIDFPTQ